MIIVIDENLPPSWSKYLSDLEHDAKHWKDFGSVGDSDELIFEYALKNNAIILTQDLDFTRMLALRGTNIPTVIQLRVDCPLPSIIGNEIQVLLNKYKEQILNGALITVDGSRHRIRLLPLT